jgi:hypothetical protein
MPDHIYRGSLGRAEEKQYGKDNWYDWCSQHWGTKWDISDPIIDDESSEYYNGEDRRFSYRGEQHTIAEAAQLTLTVKKLKRKPGAFE